MNFINTFTKHRAEPEKSLDEYHGERRLALGRGLWNRKKLYLDTNYWILLRNCELGRLDDEVVTELLQLLRDRVRAGKLVCPLSADVFIEILRQTDNSALRCSVELIDALSLGVSIASREERIRQELLSFVLKNILGEKSCHPPGLLVWTKLAYTFGSTSPCNTPFSTAEELTIQKAFLDQMWEVSLRDIIDIMGMGAIRNMPRIPNLSIQLNNGKFAHAGKDSSLKQMFLSEIEGTLDTMLPDLQEMAAYLYERFMGVAPPKDRVDSTNGHRMFANLIYNAFRLNSFTTELPTIRIPAMLHAAIRWDTQRRYKQGDMPDIRHAEAALPYHQMFLTEKSLTHLVTRRDLGLDQLSGCQVLSTPNQAVQAIRALASHETGR
jgi:hypothetical protein